jgi:hypothetical protein
MLLLTLPLGACAPSAPRATGAIPAPPPALDADSDGHAPPADCDDDDPLSFPGADERCDSSDNDCDGLVDEDPAVDAPTWYLDVDADGYGSSVDAVTSCAPPSEEWVLNGDDCEPTNPDIHPGMTEVCNGEDDDCDGLADNPPISGDTLWYPDVDRDGFGDASADGLCEPEPGFVSNNLDCGDGDAEVKPGVEEVCNDGVDNDCSGVAEGCEWPGMVQLDDSMRLVQTSIGGEGFGSSLVFSDVDGDGAHELVVAEVGLPPVGSGPRGGFHVIELPISPGSTTAGAAVWRPGAASLNYMAQRMAAADLDGDGLDDLAMSSVLATAAGHGEGAVLVGHGPLPRGPGEIDGHFDARVFHDGVAREFFGRELSIVGDVSGDGLPDLAVGVERLDYPANAGGAVVLSRPRAGVSSVWDGAAAYVTAEDGDNFGWCIAGGEVNGDGVSDLIVGAPYRSGTGEVNIYFGPLSGGATVDASDVTIAGRRTGAGMGAGCATLGDSNGDGYEDVGLGASSDDYGWVGVFMEGFGGPTVSARDASAQFIGTASGSGGMFGASVRTGGDLNQDGVPDLMVGEAEWDPLAARAWFGPAAGTTLDTDADITIWTPDELGGYLRNGLGGHDLTGDTVPDILLSDELREEGRVWLVPGIGF